MLHQFHFVSLKCSTFAPSFCHGMIYDMTLLTSPREGVAEFVAAHWIGCLKTVPWHGLRQKGN